jgi:atypical dual specificity phosphatase
MSPPEKFSWVEKPYLAAMARPIDKEELNWLRAQGIQLIISLTESPLRRDWVNDAGLMTVHVPVVDFTPPAPEQLDHCLSVINRAIEQKFGVVVHCAAGLGRTGTLLAVWYVAQGLEPATAITKVREMRPGSIETPEQERAVYNFAAKNASAHDRSTTYAPPLQASDQTAESANDTSHELSHQALDNTDDQTGVDEDSKTRLHKLLQSVVSAIDAIAGAIWIRTKRGFLQLTTQINLENVSLDKHKNGRISHNELLRYVVHLNRPLIIEPYGHVDIPDWEPAGNPTDHFCLLVPVHRGRELEGLLEIWTSPRNGMEKQRNFLNYLVQMSDDIRRLIRKSKSDEDDNARA